MKYISTRGGMAPLAFSDTILMGLAPDGGLALPESYPQVGRAQLDAWRDLSYAELAFEIIRLFATDIPEADLKAILDRTYTAEVYGSEAITPVKRLHDGLVILELSNGPTLAFKDMAMQFLGNLFEYVLAKKGEQLNIVGATSGDTGSAAEYAMRGKQGINVFMLSPDGLMSPFQRAQMYSLQDANIHNIAIKGMFDDCQDIVKAVQNDHAFKSQYKIGTVNSINWARVVAQVVYYFKGYFNATSSNDEQVSFCVPSGNFGNVCAGHIARQMGLPVQRLIVATNENDVLDEFFKTGRYQPRGTANTWVTSSPSMDISKASNFERFVFDLLGRDGAAVAALWAEVDAGRGFDLGDKLAQIREQFGFVSGKSSHADRLATIRTVDAEDQVVVDTHTADGIKVAREVRLPGETIVCLETALPAKFADTIREALNRDAPRPAGFEGLEDLPQKVTVFDADADAVKAYVRQALA
ncbi:MAG: threonine synthase [Vogesella sp.]|uniref:threonine synthase n=1 Tax=Vogesella sp. TaxID=1904252 RepID=UPI00391A09C9